MKAITGQVAYDNFLARLRSAPERVLLLDYDGTLAPFQTDRDSAFPYPEVPGLLTRIQATGTRIVLISGRPAREVVLLAQVHPHTEVWGSHGWERLRPNGEYQVGPLSNQQQDGLSLAVEVLKPLSLNGRVEPKPGGVAVHWRGMAPGPAEHLRQSVLPLWHSLQSEHQLRIAEFDGGIEIRPLGRDKGDAVDVILTESGPDAAMAYLGDDLTDEDAFRTLKGKGLAVLVRPGPRPSAADTWLKPPQELFRFLREWLQICGGAA